AERDTAFTVDACCWVIGGRPPYRQHIILGPYVDVIASRVLRPGEYQGEELRRPMYGVLKATGIAAQAWYDTAPEMLGWRRCPDVGGICRYYGAGEWMEFLHLGEYPLYAAPPDFKWVVTIRRRDRP
ncbi:MAG: hypothetical protein GY766_21590, partial [Herbaspirillum sp.]|uniref:hypothetical protein n=1 Tax=Herbaspirillum sp. TaxID=1890675 RepID=UPI002588F7CE